MNNTFAIKVLKSHFVDIADEEYKIAIKMVIEALRNEAKMDYYAFKPGISLREYLDLSEEEIE